MTSSTYVLYDYVPSLGGAVAFAILFAATTAVHLFQRIRTHAKYFNPFIVGGIFQVIGYGARADAHFNTTSTTVYALQTLLILLAPTLYAASIYMVLGRIITFLHAQHLSVVPVKWMTKIFVSGDILSFILQGAGGGIMSGGFSSSLKIGQWVIVAGLCVQLVFFGAFLIASLTFHFRIEQSPTVESEKNIERDERMWPRDWRGLLGACYLVSFLILVRSVYRLIEFAQGNSGYVISHEVFLYVFDAAMMFLVMLVMNLFHPSVVLRGDGHRRVESVELGLRVEEHDSQ
ncbi:RTA1 like protein [Aspergillus sclerotioniger CBS 115572]|uniref:RTA1 like protein n=1 Tax=Aspergillus sclerotioniger CBS 115572 TaxID=1450535 RepID=A0A317WWJ3_9EURO|nr:RTA1 like protein [Aspergillus sclerotioniger CBS 115572]PWY90415.1 RTA1 like protein [Aspergillus sclerotioniger CBS 115572]